MRINTNIMAMNALRNYNSIFTRIQKSMERLSTGYRINRAADDPAGLAISEKMRAQIRGMRVASRNSQDAISLVQTAEGALQETHNILQRLREIAIQSASDTYETSIDRAALNAEFQHLLKEIDDIANKTVFNDQPLLNGKHASSLTGFDVADPTGSVYSRFLVGPSLLDGTYSLTSEQDADGNAIFNLEYEDGTVYTETLDLSKTYDSTKPITLSFGGQATLSFKLENDLEIKSYDDIKTHIMGAGEDISNIAFKRNGMTIQTGANQGDELRISIDAMNTTILGLTDVNVATREGASAAIGRLDRALNTVSTQRAELGAMQNRLEYKINNLENSIINLSDAESRIRDLDYAAELTELTKLQIQFQFATAMLAQANLIPQTVLQLLQAM